MSNNLENKVSHELPPGFSKLVLQEAKFLSPQKQIFTVKNTETEETMLMNIYQAPNSKVNYEASINYNELLVALAIKQKSPQHTFQVLNLKTIERNDPIHEYNSTFCCMVTYKYQEVVSLADILKKKRIDWNELSLLIVLQNLICSLSEINKAFNFQKDQWQLTSDAVYYNIDEERFIVQVEPTIKFLESRPEDEQVENFAKAQNIDMENSQEKNLLRAALIIMQIYGLASGLKKEDLDYNKIVGEMRNRLPRLMMHLSTVRKNISLEDMQQRLAKELHNENMKLELKPMVELEHLESIGSAQDLNYYFYSTYIMLNNIKKGTEYFNEYFTSLITKKENQKSVKALIEFAISLYLLKRYEETQDKLAKVQNFYKEFKLHDPETLYCLNILHFLLARQNSNSKLAINYLEKCSDIMRENPSIFPQSVMIELQNKRLKLYQSLHSTLNENEDETVDLRSEDNNQDVHHSNFTTIIFAENLRLRKLFPESTKYFRKVLKQCDRIYGTENSIIHTIIYTNLGDISKLQGDYTHAANYYKKTLEIKESLFEPNHPELILCQEKIGLLNNEIGEFKKALEGFRRTLQMKKITYGDQSIEAATTLNMIGTVYRSLNQYELAQENYKKCHEIFSKTYGERHLAIATILNNMGAISNKLRDNDKALKYYEKSYDIFQAHFGEDHPIITTCLNNLGTLYQSLHENRKAIESFLKAIEIYKKHHGENNENMASLQYSLGVSYESENEFDKAEECFKRALEIAKILSKEESLDAVRIYKALGGLYKNKKNMEAAYHNYIITLDLQKKLLSPEDHEIANTLNLLGTLCYSAGIHEEAISYYEKALEIFEKDENNFKDIDRGYLLNNMASVYKALNNHPKSLELYQKSMETFRSKYGKNHPTIGIILNNIGAIYRLEGQNEEAIDNYKRALEILIQVFGKYHPTVATIYNNIGTLYTYLGAPEEALTNLNKSLKLSRVVIGESHAGVAALYFSLGKLYLTFEDHTKAQAHLQKALELYQKIYPDENHSIFPKVYYGLGEAHRNLNDIPISKEFHEKAINIQLQFKETDEFEIALSQFALGLIAVHNDEPNKAMEYFSLAETAWEIKHGLESVQVAQCCYQTGSILRSLKDYDASLSHLLRAFEILDKSELYGDFLMANVRSELGLVYQNIGDYPKALENHRHALEIRKKKSADINYDLVCSYNNVGLCYNLMGQYDKSLEYTKKAYDGMIQVYGENHVFVIGALINLGGITDKLAKYKEALEYFHLALDIRAKNKTDDDDLETAKIYNNLGGSYFHLGDYKKAIEYYSKSLQVRRLEHGEEHQEVATSYNNLGLVEDKLGNYAKALEHHQASLKIRTKIHGNKHPSLAISLNNIGLALQNMMNYREALTSYKKAYDILKNIYKSAKHPMIATVLNNMAIVNKHLNNQEEALKNHEKALDIQKQFLKDNHPEIATTLNDIGELYYHMGNYKKSLEKHQQALDIRYIIYRDTDHPDIAASLNNCGSAFKAVGEFPKALQNYQSSLDIITKIHGEESPEALILYLNLSSLYDKMGNEEKSKYYAEKHANIQAKISDQSIHSNLLGV